MVELDSEIIIAGGGPVGVGLAIDLAQRGHDVLVVEKYSRPQLVPKGQNLTSRTMEHLAAWGADQIARSKRPTSRSTGNGGLNCYKTLLSGYHYGWLNRESVRSFYYEDVERLPQYVTEDALRERASELSNIRWMSNHEAVGCSTEDNLATVRVRDRETDSVSELRARFLVGCDGSHSVIRRSASITQTMNDHDRKMALVVFRSTELDELLSELPYSAFYNALDPKLEGYWKFVGRVNSDGEWFFHAPVPQDATKESFDFPGYLHETVGTEFDLEISYVGFWDLRFAIADSYQNGRILIAGDAAHSHPPYGGYGINTGFEDARNLGWKLSYVLKGIATDSLLQSYTEERQPVFQSTSKQFIEYLIEDDKRFLDRWNGNEQDPEFKDAWNSRTTNSLTVTQYEPNYRGSRSVIDTNPADATPSAVGEHSTVARPGHHLSPPPNHPNFQAALGYDFVLIHREKTNLQGIRNQANGNTFPLKLLTADEEAFSGWEADWILVRPDHFVAAKGSGDDFPPDLLSRVICA